MCGNTICLDQFTNRNFIAIRLIHCRVAAWFINATMVFEFLDPNLILVSISKHPRNNFFTYLIQDAYQEQFCIFRISWNIKNSRTIKGTQSTLRCPRKRSRVKTRNFKERNLLFAHTNAILKCYYSWNEPRIRFRTPNKEER